MICVCGISNLSQFQEAKEISDISEIESLKLANSSLEEADNKSELRVLNL